MTKLINSEGILYTRMFPIWAKVSPSALMGNTDEMRAQGEKYLPKEQLEDDESYKLRLQHSFLYNGYRDTIEKCVARPFSRDVILKNGNDRTAKMLGNADGKRQSITQVLKQYFLNGINFGVGHLLVDLPNMAKALPDGQQATLADEVEKLIPYCTNISPLSLIWWDFEETEDGPELTEIHIRDYIVKKDPADRYNQIEYCRISVYTKTDWQLYEAPKGSSKFEQIDQGTHSFGRVPLFSWYSGEQIAPLVAKPPLMDLADLNIAHWQSSSQQRNYLRFIRIGFLFIRGMSDEDLRKNLTNGILKLGPQNILVTENSEAGANYLEHQGTAYQAGERDLTELKAQMTVIGLQPFVEMASNTATGSAIPEAKYQSRLQMWCKLCSAAATQAVMTGCAAAGDELDDDFEASIYSDFGISVDNIAKVDKIFQAFRDKLITAETALRELQRYGIIDERVDIEDEVAAAAEAKQEGALNELGLDPNNPDSKFGKGMEIDGKPPENTKNPSVPLKKQKAKTPFQNPEKAKS